MMVGVGVVAPAPVVAMARAPAIAHTSPPAAVLNRVRMVELQGENGGQKVEAIIGSRNDDVNGAAAGARPWYNESTSTFTGTIEHFMESDNIPGKIPPLAQKEIRSSLAAIGIKATLAAEQLQAEADPARAAVLREQIEALKAEAKALADRYRGARAPQPEAPPDRQSSSSGNLIVFSELDELAAKAFGNEAAAVAKGPSDSFGELPLMVDLVGVDPSAAPSVFGGATLDPSSGTLDEVTYALTFAEEAEASRVQPARGGRLGLALGIAAELSAGREAEWGGPLLASALETVVLVLSRGGDEEEVAAAALYGFVESSTEDIVLQDIRATLGDRVVELVAWAAWMLRIDPWEERDRAYATRLQSAPPSALAISLAGRLISARAMMARRVASGTGALDRPGRERERLVWSLRALVKAYRAVIDPASAGPLLDEWEAAVESITQPRPSV